MIRLGWKGWPRSTSEARRRYLRAKRKSGPTYLWAWVAGVLSVVALAGYWIVLFQLVEMPPNALSDVSRFPRMTVVLMILMGSLVSPLMEEAGFRGYFQVAFEREVRARLAVVISSVVFALAHGPTQGFLWPKLLFYRLVGIAFGATAYLTNSTLPAIPVHFVGLLQAIS
jgi:membrane protease YdiL (CAAX protease family)